MRENEEDPYAGIEYQLSPTVMECTKLISRPRCEKIVRYAFEHPRLHARKTVTCFTKDNIMKMTNGITRPSIRDGLPLLGRDGHALFLISFNMALRRRALSLVW